MPRLLSEPEKKIVAHRQGWRCSVCAKVLPACYQVDHTVPLWCGGADAITNATAMCPNCHCAKTQREAAARAVASRAPDYANRWDTYVAGGTVAVCTRCGRQRPANTPHLVCSAMGAGADVALKAALACFAFHPR